MLRFLNIGQEHPSPASAFFSLSMAFTRRRERKRAPALFLETPFLQDARYPATPPLKKYALRFPRRKAETPQGKLSLLETIRSTVSSLWNKGASPYFTAQPAAGPGICFTYNRARSSMQHLRPAVPCPVSRIPDPRTTVPARSS